MRVAGVCGILVLGMASLLASMALAGGKSHDSWNEVWISDSSFQDFAYALVEPTATGGSLTLTGQESDRAEVLRQHKRVPGSLVWVRSGQERYLIRDPAAIAQAKEILEPELALNREQSRLGDLQSDIGDTQSKIGDEQSRIGDEQAKLGDRQATLADKAVDASAGGSRQQAYEREQQEILQQQEELGRAQARLGEMQAKVGRDQAKLGAEQEKFGAHRREVQGSVRSQMKDFLATARTTGRATKL
jgi:hypothetical protein